METARNQATTVRSVNSAGSSEGTSDPSTSGDSMLAALANAISTNEWDTFRCLVVRQPQINDNILGKAVGYATLPKIDEILKELASLGLAMPVFRGDYDNVMFNAIRYNDVETLKTLLQDDKYLDLVRNNTSGQVSPLHVAIIYKQSFVAQLLLKSGANVFAEDGHGNSSIDYAVKSENISPRLFRQFAVVKEGLNDAILLSNFRNSRYKRKHSYLFRGANVFARTKTGQSLLHMIVCNAEGGTKVAEQLLDYGADPNEKIGSGTLLHYSKNRSITEILLQYGADINVVDGDGNTPLTRIEHGSDKTALRYHVVMLREAGMYVHPRNLENWKETKFTRDLAAECEKDVLFFKSQKIGNFPYSSLDILALSVNRLAKLAGNNAWLEAVKKGYRYGGAGICRNNNYGRLIFKKLQMGKLRHKFLEKGLKALEIILPNLPLLCSDIVVNYLSNEDIHNLGVVANLGSLTV